MAGLKLWAEFPFGNPTLVKTIISKNDANGRIYCKLSEIERPKNFSRYTWLLIQLDFQQEYS